MWEVRVYLGRDPDTGRKRYKSRTVRGPKREAERVCRDLVTEAEAAAEEVRSAEFPTVASWLDDWWPVKRDEISPTTASSWQSSVTLYLKPHLGDMALHEVRPHHLESMYRELVDSGLAASRVQKVHTVASVAFNAAVRRELIAASPAQAARAPAAERQEPTAPTPGEVRTLLEAAADDLDMFAFLVLAANTGARRGELCALRWCDVDLDNRVVTISRAVAKGAGRGAVVRQTKTAIVGRIAISRQAAAALERLQADRRGRASAAGVDLASTAFVWSQDVEGERPVYPDTMSARFAKTRDRAGVSGVQLRHLRHFAATQLLAAGVDVRTVAGRLRHARPAMTLDRYAAWVPARDRDAADLLDGLSR